MSIYSHKQRWKIVLMVAAVAIVAASLWYTGQITNRLRKEEIRKVEQWALDIRSNIEQLNISDQSFSQQRGLYAEMKQRERKDVERWAAATRELSRDQLDYTFLISIIQENQTIPVILTDDQGRVSSIKNTGFERKTFVERVTKQHPDWQEDACKKLADSLYNDTLVTLISSWRQLHEPIEISIQGSIRNRVYYRESDRLLDFDRQISALQPKSDSLFARFNTSLASGNPLVPMVFLEDSTNRVLATNLPASQSGDPEKLEQLIDEMKGENEPIPVYFGDQLRGNIYYRNSDLLDELRIYPYVQFGIIGVFLLIAYFLFSTFRNAEQNQVWVGMAKETAHQLGTPISSLMAWTELLREQGTPDEVVVEMNKDLDRLRTVSERFSKIGSAGAMEPESLGALTRSVTDYLRGRISKRVNITVNAGEDSTVPLNAPLMAWVIENLAKNAVDAMEGEGDLEFSIFRENERLIMEVRDTGKGIPRNKFKTVFRPGYSTKQRGWGLGLALVKRIVEEYHKGKIVVKDSEPGKGTTFRISLRG
jgi:signal transduction histidine kinase